MFTTNGSISLQSESVSDLCWIDHPHWLFACADRPLWFASNEDVAAAVTWGMLGNIIGILFAALSDIFINGFSLAAAVVGEFLPAAGPNLIFAAILVPLLVGAYAAVQKQSGR